MNPNIWLINVCIVIYRCVCICVVPWEFNKKKIRLTITTLLRALNKRSASKWNTCLLSEEQTIRHRAIILYVTYRSEKSRWPENECLALDTCGKTPWNNIQSTCCYHFLFSMRWFGSRRVNIENNEKKGPLGKTRLTEDSANNPWIILIRIFPRFLAICLNWGKLNSKTFEETRS